ncbi:MAG: rhomboid family intramembrane serine protease [Arcobacter sp.]|uniref:rhomboid family intramembrane serine protease n=1 Tax=uncultured Arcobacter sp. TaxID=165434 RepID=UPI000CB3015A|nr:rhomboid family intramembrane serine protease [uncultured Arcobacter sp.]PLY09310.1 MAG: rhomboid family intramembrane serine protease [Arcobacter sp.]
MQNNKLLTVSNFIILVTILMYILQTNMDNGSLFLGLNIFFLEANLWYQPLSSMFAHGGVGHILMNMFVLFQFGNLIEKYRGVKTFLILYFIGGILTSLLSFAFMQMMGFNHNLVGASGAICVLLGYVALVDTYQRNGIITWIILISIVPVLIGLPVAWYAHLIGLAVGFSLGKFLR